MKSALSPLAAERQFFTSLVEGGLEDLDRILENDFIMVDVMTGSEITKAALLAAVGSQKLQFEAIEPVEARVRFYDKAAVITGRTRMSGSLEAAPFTVESRYTHVYIEQHGRWSMVSAQGTKITVQR